VIIARRRVHTQKYGIGLTGLIDGVNQAYTTPDKFNPSAHAIYYNGQRLSLTLDYSIAESGGPGAGFDTVNFLVTPKVGDHLLADYISA
jgi:hypothetical protein